MKKLLRLLQSTDPVKVVLTGYFSYIILGCFFLCMPFMHKVAAPFLDNLFISASAVSTTGLTTVDVNSTYTFLGQLVILVLIQLGGIGYMTFSSFVILTSKKQLTDEVSGIAKTVFSIPKNFHIEKFIKSVMLFTIVFELIGAAGLYVIFSRNGVEHAVWRAIFHSVSAFCTAGFSLFSNSFESYSGHVWLNVIISALSLIGAMGFIVCVDIWRKMRGKQKKVTLTSKIIITTTFWFLTIGTFLVFVTEPSISHYSPDKRLMMAFFQVMTSITTVGFNSINVASLSKSVLVLTGVLMIVGASPSGTGGGLKTTTFSSMFGLVKAVMQGKKEVTFWKAPVPDDRIRVAVASIGFYLSTFAVGTYLLALTENSAFIALMFECASALGTVGLSMGITSSLTVLGKLIVIILMYIGRVGPLTFGVAVFVKPLLIFDDEQSDLAI